MNKNVITHLIAALLVVAGFSLEEPYQKPVLNMGLFALAGGLTNWLAIHMLFEKVPGLYGSGVIAARFEDFKTAIYTLIMEQFFSKENLDRFFAELVMENETHHLDFTPVIKTLDLGPAFDSLTATIMESSFGSMLAMFGGEAALAPLRDPFIEKMKQALDEIAHSESFQAQVRAQLQSRPVSDEIYAQIAQIVQSRLNELTPQDVKQIIQAMIQTHLGWLVVWGGVFGGVIGLISSQLPV